MKSMWTLFTVITIAMDLAICQRGGSSRQNHMPETIDLRIPYSKNKEINMRLIKIPDNVDKVKVVVGDKSGSHEEPQDPNKHFSIYKDQRMYASFSVTDNRINGGWGFTFYGSFRYNGNIFTLEPVYPEDESVVNDFDRDYVITIDGLRYHLRRKAENTHGGVDETSLNNTDSEYLHFKKGKSKLFSKDKQILTIEILFVLDYSMFAKWMRLTDNNKNLAVQNMKYYFSEIVGGIKMRYENIVTERYQFTAALAGFYIAETPEMAPFTETTKIAPNTINHLDAIKKLKEWVTSLGNVSMPRFDVAALFTSYETLGVNGVAFVSGVCKVIGVSVNRDNGPFQSADTAAHEIGHNVGSNHDEGIDSCRPVDQYVMAPGRTDVSDWNFDNPFHFSNCSIKYFLYQVSELNRVNKNCLEDYPESSEPVHADKFLKGGFGQNYPLDYQCRIAFNENATLYSPGLEGDKNNICDWVKCFWTIGEHHLMRPADGTSCGLKSWCKNGRCVKNADAPTFRDTCLLGDSKELINMNTGKQNCSQLIGKTPSLCAKKYYRNLCCESCLRQKTSQNTNCPYGDHLDRCNAAYCQSPYYRTLCCRTCNVLSTERLPANHCEEEEMLDWCADPAGYACLAGDDSRCCVGCAKLYDATTPDCKYGDQGSWCIERVRKNPKECKSPSIQKACCRSCQKVGHTNNDKTVPKVTKPPPSKGCQDAEDCRSISSYHCYSMEKKCCAKCKAFENSNEKDCKYGDRAGWCKSQIQKDPKKCKLSSYSTSCCATCKEVVKNLKNATSDECRDMQNCQEVTSYSCYRDESVCCASCRKFLKDKSDCKYGDKFEWCPGYATGSVQCNHASTRQKCCHSCSKYP